MSLALQQITEIQQFDGIVSVAVGCLLGWTAGFLIQQNRIALLGKASLRLAFCGKHSFVLSLLTYVPYTLSQVVLWTFKSARKSSRFLTVMKW